MRFLMKRPGILAGIGVCVFAVVALAEHAVNNTRMFRTPAMPKPAYLETVQDPVFGSKYQRVTNPGGPPIKGLPCERAYCTHRYSSAQAWNADQSLLLITNGCNGFCFLDGRTFKPLFRRTMYHECEWHPMRASDMICVGGTRVYAWQPREKTTRTIFEAKRHKNLRFGPLKGALSQEGTHLVVHARDARNREVAFVLDLESGEKNVDIRLAKLGGKPGHCSISPSTKYVFCIRELAGERTEAFILTPKGKLVQHWGEHHRPGHGDMTIDADGSDVYVGISKSDPDKWHVIKRRLHDSKVTILAGDGYGEHVSLRNIKHPGWAFVSYGGTYFANRLKMHASPFYQEVVAIRIDGSGDVRRIVQTRNPRHNYWSETHASPSPDGTMVIWSSNWGRPGGPVADYVAHIEWPAEDGR